VIQILQNVWVYANRPLHGDEAEFLQGLVPDGENKTSLDCALEYLRMDTLYEACGRPNFGKFREFWSMCNSRLTAIRGGKYHGL